MREYKFKPGDRVKVLSGMVNEDKRGDTVTISRIDSEHFHCGAYYTKSKHDSIREGWYAELELELAHEEPEKPKVISSTPIIISDDEPLAFIN